MPPSWLVQILVSLGIQAIVVMASVAVAVVILREKMANFSRSFEELRNTINEFRASVAALKSASDKQDEINKNVSRMLAEIRSHIERIEERVEAVVSRRRR